MDFTVGYGLCNEHDLITQSIVSVGEGTCRPNRILIVDNGDTAWAPPAGFVEEHKLHVVRPQTNLGCAGAWNLIHRLAAPLTTVILNADCAVASDTLEKVMAPPAPVVVLAYAFGCFRIDEEMWCRVGEFDADFYPVYWEDTDYRYRMKLGGVQPVEWDSRPSRVVSLGREEAASKIQHGKHDPQGYQGWRGAKLAWFQDCLEKNHQRYVAKWGGEPTKETFTTPWGRP